MKEILENDLLKVVIDHHGAEIVSLYDKENEREILWQAEEPFWQRQSPILFPVIGRSHTGEYRYQGISYEAIQHGFAKDKEFECVDYTDTFVDFLLVSDEKTIRYFPYAFEFHITFRLEGRSVLVSWKVENISRDTMYFAIGGHPGFNVPILPNTKQTDYYLLFKKGPVLKYRQVHDDGGTIDMTKEYDLKLEEAGEYYRCHFTEHMFDNDALVFDDGQFDWVGIGYPDGTPYVGMDCAGFTNFGIWTMPGGPYICLEPWMGRCDDYGFTGDITEKRDMIALEAGDIFKQNYKMTLYK